MRLYDVGPVFRCTCPKMRPKLRATDHLNVYTRPPRLQHARHSSRTAPPPAPSPRPALPPRRYGGDGRRSIASSRASSPCGTRENTRGQGWGKDLRVVEEIERDSACSSRIIRSCTCACWHSMAFRAAASNVPVSASPALSSAPRRYVGSGRWPGGTAAAAGGGGRVERGRLRHRPPSAARERAPW